MTRNSARPLSTLPTNGRLFQNSLSGWYANWKAQQAAPATPAAPTGEPEPARRDGDDVSELANWIRGGTGE